MSNRYSKLPGIESDFKMQNKPKLIPFDYSKGIERVQGLFYKPPTADYYYTDLHPKKRVVIHFTAGNLRGDMGQLSMDHYHVSVPFVIARDGTIYQFFYTKYWSHHLGMTSGNPGKIYDKQSIAIELSNYGWLTLRDGMLETAYSRQKINGKENPADIYCSLDDTDAYVELDLPFREKKYFAAHTPVQVESLTVLIRYLTALYDIPRAFLPETDRYNFAAASRDIPGINSHINFRASGKWDIGMAFDWDTLIDGVQADEFLPVLHPINTTRAAGARAMPESELATSHVTGTIYDPKKKTKIRAYNPFQWE